MKPSSRSSRQLPEHLVVALLAVLVAASGCVTRGTHEQVVRERDELRDKANQLSERVAFLEASNESLAAERVELIGTVEDLRHEQTMLQRSVDELEVRRSELSAELQRTAEALDSQKSEVDEMRSTYDGLVSDLQAEVSAGRIQIENLREGLRVKLSQEILFPLGSAELGPDGTRVLEKVASRLAGVPHRVEVEGFTDDLPIRGSLAARYPSNWELAGARAARVVRLLAAQGVPAERLSAVSHADTRPVASNATAEGRARNRRIEIRLVPDEGTPPAPPAAKPAPAPAPAPAPGG